MLPAALLAAAAAAATPRLRDLGKAHGIFIGSQFSYPELYNQSDTAQYRQVHSEQYSISTVGNMCKWKWTHPQKDSYTLHDCLDAFAYARGAGQEFRGHNLCWVADQHNPQWLIDYAAGASRQELTDMLTSHVTTVMTGLAKAGRVYAWDVVNEAILDKGGLRNGTWYPKVPDYIDQAFTAARKADPNAKLFYNDYNWVHGGAKADSILDMVAGMQKRGVPIDGVGFQAHIKLSGVGSTEAAETYLQQANATIARAAAMGLEVHITELDVACNIDRCQPPAADREALQAQLYSGLLRVCLSHPKCKSFETWGFTDAHTSTTKKYFRNVYPLPFDRQYQPKAEFWAMVGVLNGTQA
eukprot:TRINITY_DN178_c0_g1_i1.p2 TRINITY_DN178_c0_g1~~TRINITY_DN178_c0_g1_i1.p2  ORF type:complete len:381 (+),score=146.59 TRINITY_DN178_c0_g1_i1:80-1144(+)